MTAYPFAPSPSFDELFAKLRQLGVEVTPMAEVFRDPEEGEEYRMVSLVRRIEGRTLPCMQPIPTGDTHARWSLVRSICACLELSPALFGLDENDLRPDEE